MIKIVVFILFLGLELFGSLQKSDILPVMQTKIGNAVELLQQRSDNKEFAAQSIFDELDSAFDFAQIAKLSLGNTQWNSLDKQQQQLFTTAFTLHLKNSFVEKLSLYSNQKIVIDELKEVKNRLHLNTKLIDEDNIYEINYKFYDAKEHGWLIYDIDIIGVSIIQTYRSQFGGFLKSHSFEALIQWLKEHTVL